MRRARLPSRRRLGRASVPEPSIALPAAPRSTPTPDILKLPRESFATLVVEARHGGPILHDVLEIVRRFGFVAYTVSAKRQRRIRTFEIGIKAPSGKLGRLLVEALSRSTDIDDIWVRPVQVKSIGIKNSG